MKVIRKLRKLIFLSAGLVSLIMLYLLLVTVLIENSMFLLERINRDRGTQAVIIDNSRFLRVNTEVDNTTKAKWLSKSIHKYDLPDWQRNLTKTHRLEDWQRNLPNRQHQNQTFYLAIALQVRIYENDKAKWTLRELKQWMYYVFWAGVGHIYLCDHYTYDNETLEPLLQKYIDSNLVTYFPWNKIKRAMSAQVACYQHIIDKYKDKTKWQMAIDMDEYPYVHNDTREGFLIRFLKTVASDVSEVSMPNFLMLGQGDRSRDMVIERVTRIKSLTKQSNGLDKPIYRPQFVQAGIHHTALRKGRVQDEKGKHIKCLHYWGARLQNWGPDTNKTFEETETFTEIREKLGPIVRKSMLAFGEDDAFSKNTGP